MAPIGVSQPIMLRAIISNFFKLAILNIALTGCAPKFQLNHDQFNERLRESYPYGSSYLKMKTELISHGFRMEVDNNNRGTFSFSNTGGLADCGQIIDGSTNPTGEYGSTRRATDKITHISGNQGCFRTFVP